MEIELLGWKVSNQEPERIKKNLYVYRASWPKDHQSGSAKGFINTAGERWNLWKKKQELLPTTGDNSEVVHDFNDGWTIRRLHTFGDLDYEGALMNNSVRFYSKDKDFTQLYPTLKSNDGHMMGASGEGRIYSLRDPHNIPHVSFLEIDDLNNILWNVSGAKNKFPKWKHQTKMREYLRAKAGEGYIQWGDGKWSRILPSGSKRIENPWKAVKEAANSKAWYVKRHKQLIDLLGPEDSDTVHEFPDGWSVKRLKTKRDLMIEGIMAEHCTATSVANDIKRCECLLRPENTPDCKQCKGRGILGLGVSALDDHEFKSKLDELSPGYPNDYRRNDIFSLRDKQDVVQAAWQQPRDLEGLNFKSIEQLSGRNASGLKPEHHWRVLEYLHAKMPEDKKTHIMSYHGSFDQHLTHQDLEKILANRNPDLPETLYGTRIGEMHPSLEPFKTKWQGTIEMYHNAGMRWNPPLVYEVPTAASRDSYQFSPGGHWISNDKKLFDVRSNPGVRRVEPKEYLDFDLALPPKDHLLPPRNCFCGQIHQANIKTAGNSRAWFLRKKEKLREILGPGNEETIHDFGDGWTVKKMRSNADYIYEGNMAEHCTATQLLGGRRGCECLRDPVKNLGTCGECGGKGFTHPKSETTQHMLKADAPPYSGLHSIISLRDPDDISQAAWQHNYLRNGDGSRDVHSDIDFGKVSQLVGRGASEIKPEHGFRFLKYLHQKMKETGTPTVTFDTGEKFNRDEVANRIAEENDPIPEKLYVALRPHEGWRTTILPHNWGHTTAESALSKLLSIGEYGGKIMELSTGKVKDQIKRTWNGSYAVGDSAVDPEKNPDVKPYDLEIPKPRSLDHDEYNPDYDDDYNDDYEPDRDQNGEYWCEACGGRHG